MCGDQLDCRIVPTGTLAISAVFPTQFRVCPDRVVAVPLVEHEPGVGHRGEQGPVWMGAVHSQRRFKPWGIEPRRSRRCTACSRPWSCVRSIDHLGSVRDPPCPGEKAFRSNETCCRLAKIRSVGPRTATAIVAAVGHGSVLINGRHVTAHSAPVPPDTWGCDGLTLY